MKELCTKLLAALSLHWQVIFGGLLYYFGKDILDVATHNYWAMHFGQLAQDVSLYVIGFRAISATYQEPPAK